MAEVVELGDSDVEENIPSAAECDARCKEFASVTGTDSALAMFYLQDREWDLQKSLDAYFEETAPQNTGSTEKAEPYNDPEPHRIRVMSWNIDGLDSNNVQTRCKAVCNVIMKEVPSVVFLQEVVPLNLEVLQQRLSKDYDIYEGGAQGYFNAVLLHKHTTAFAAVDIVNFFSSSMGRHLIKIEATVKDIPCLLMTSHLESTKAHAAERQRQLKAAWKIMKEAPADQTVIFAGDLNLRDPEVAASGGIPEGILDIWEVTGQRSEAKFTWDLTRNDNLELEGLRFKPRCRFDRMYLRHATAAAAATRVKPVYFELTGIERVHQAGVSGTCRRFPSDHWGILAHLNKT